MINKRKKKIIFVVDGNNKIGLGHVYRTLNLAKELKKSIHDILFLTNDSLVMKLIKPKFHCMYFPNGNSSMKKSVMTKNDVIIVDKLHVSRTKLYFLKSNSSMIIGIDYIGGNKKLFSKGINILYQKTGITGINTNSGFQYAILNSHFLKAKPIKVKKIPKSLVIMQGGTDSHCFLPIIVNFISNIIKDVKITIIVGSDFQCDKKLKKIMQKNGTTLNIQRNVKNMSQELTKYDIAITGGGMTLLELCKLGIPAIVICTEKFENETASILSDSGFGINLGYYRNVSKSMVINAINTLTKNYKLRCKMNKNGKKIIDGCGTERVSKLIMEWMKTNEYSCSCSTP